MAISVDRQDNLTAALLTSLSSLLSQVQRHRVPDLSPLLGPPHSPPAGAGLGPGGPLLHPAVHRLQPGDPPRHLHLQAVHQHGRPHQPGQGAPLLPLLLHPVLGPPHPRHDGLLRLHHHHNLP